MRKKKTKVLCMICGKQLNRLDESSANIVEGTTFEFIMSYGSTLDGNVYNAALCDECISNAAKEKKIILKDEGVLW